MFRLVSCAKANSGLLGSPVVDARAARDVKKLGILGQSWLERSSLFSIRFDVLIGNLR